MSTLSRFILAALIALLWSSAYLLDGPSEIETMRTIQADLVDAQLMGVLK